MVSHGFSWFLMVSHGFSWFLMVSHGFSWFLMVSHGFSWFLMVSHLSSGQRVLASLRLEWAVFSFELRRHDGVSFVGQQ